MLKRDLFCSKPIKDICFRNDLVRHHDTYSISVKGISIKGSWSQFNLIFCCCCCLNSAINSPTYPPHSFSEAYKTLLLLVQGKFNTPVTARNRKARYWRNRDCFHLGLRIRQPCTLMTKRW